MTISDDIFDISHEHCSLMPREKYAVLFMLSAYINTGTSISEDAVVVNIFSWDTFLLGFLEIQCITIDLFSRCSYCSCEKSPSPYLYRLQSFQRTKMATSLHKINGVLFMGYSYSWEPDSAYMGLLIQLPGQFYTVNSQLFSFCHLGASH